MKPIAKNHTFQKTVEKKMDILAFSCENEQLLPGFSKITAYLQNQFKQKSHIKYIYIYRKIKNNFGIIENFSMLNFQNYQKFHYVKLSE